VLFERLDRVNQPERLHGWISVVASNRLVDLLRRPEYRFATAVLDEAQLADPSEDDPGPLDPEVTLALTAAVERLSPREQTVLRARILTEEPIPLKEIERRFAIPQGSVGPTLNRSVAKLRTDPDLSQKLLQCEPDRMTPMLKLAG
jgi:RNA polymerase sigma factor (sigma-70 family)